MNRQFGAFGGLAMMLIVLNHAISLGMQYPQRAGFSAIGDIAGSILFILQAFGVFAVPVFLFVSGGFLAYAAQGNPPRITWKFLLTSLRYILIPYLIWSIAFFAVVYLHWREVYSPMQYLKHLLVGYPFHFVPLLVLFYVISPGLVWAGKKYPVFLLAGVAIYQFLLIVILNPNIFGFTLPGWAGYLAIPALKQTISEWAIFFPLGLVYGLNARSWLPILRKYFWVTGLLTVLFFIVALLTGFKVIDFPAARYLCMVTFVLWMPAISRDQIPLVRWFERVGKRSYGLYLTHLITMDLFVLILQNVFPAVVGWYALLLPLLFITGLVVPIVVMELLANSPVKMVYRYIFG